MSLADVAKLAGVSTSTVSRVLRKSSEVRPETSAMVAKAIRQIGYVPVEMRASTGSRRRNRGSGPDRYFALVTVGQTIRQGFQIPVIASFVAAISELAQTQGLSVLLDELPKLGGKSRLMQRGEIGGAILLVESKLAMDPTVPGKIRELAQSVPLVWALGSHTGPLEVDRVAVDSQGIGQMAATYLAQQGCKRLAFVIDAPKLGWVRTCAASFIHTAYDQGKETALFIISDDPRDGHIFGGQVVTVSDLRECVEAMTSESLRPDGIFGLTNELTARLYPHLAKAGLAPGRDVCFLSCDNDSSRIADICPKPTTIAVNTAEVAARTMRRLLGRMAKPDDSPMLIQVPPLLAPSRKTEHASALGMPLTPR